MKHLSKEKKQQLLLVVLGTLGVLTGIWFGVISWQQGRLAKLGSEHDAVKIKLDNMSDTLKRSVAIAGEVEAEKTRLSKAETQMASGDVYAWIINTIRGFKADYPKIDIPQYSTILLNDTTLLPKFPYRQATLTVAGTAFYHDLGTFVADLENTFPYIRVQNLAIEPASGEAVHPEKLSFKMDVVALVKPEV